MTDNDFIQTLLSDLKSQLESSKTQKSDHSEYTIGYYDGQESEMANVIDAIEDYLNGAF